MGIEFFFWSPELDPWPDGEDCAEIDETFYQAGRDPFTLYPEPRFKDIIASDNDLPNPFDDD